MSQHWQVDLTFLADSLRTLHANVYHTIRHDQLQQAIDDLMRHIPNLSSHKIIVEMARIIAMIGDGHTSLWLGENAGFHTYPLRFYAFSDGIFVHEAADQAYMGMRLLAIGNTPIEAVLAKIAPVVSGDNDVMKQIGICAYLSIPEVLNALDIIPQLDGAIFTLEDSDGKGLEYQPPFFDTVSRWFHLWDNNIPMALWLRQPEKLYWYAYLEAEKTIYVQFRAIRDMQEESIAAFCDRLFNFIDHNAVERFVLDIRMNGGGDNRLNQPLVHGLICCKKINQPGKLFTIIGRRTFSAAMNLAVDLERNTKTLFVGEPTGASPNHYGETTPVTLPNSQITFILSALYWQSSVPQDKRLYIEPHLPAPLSSHDYRQNHDPALALILAY